MSSLKNTFVASMVAVSGVVCAQNTDPQQNFNTIPQQYIDTDKKSVADSTKNFLYTNISDSTCVIPINTPVAEDCVDYVATKNNPVPTYENPRKNSFIDLLQNGGLVQGVYAYKSNAYVEVKFKMEGKHTRIVVKMHQLVQDDPFGSYVLRDRFVLDGYGNYLSRNPYPSDEARSFQSFLVSTPLSYVGDKLPVVSL